MSRAFVKEPDGAEVFEPLPDRPIGPDPNLVTARGLALIEAEIERWRRALSDAQATADRAALAQASRDLRYWTARRASAEIVPAPSDPQEACFGAQVTIERGDGREQTFRIVGQDEADPAAGSISYVSPLARALVGRRVGDVVVLPNGEAEIMAIAP